MLTISERRLIVRLHKQGVKQELIGNLVGCSQQTVSNWIKYSKQRDDLNSLPRSGRPTKFNKNLVEIKNLIKTKIEEKNKEFGSITTKEIRELIQKKIGILYSMRHVQRLMHKLGFSLIKPRSMHLKHDQEAVDNFRTEFKKNIKKPIWIMK